MDKLNGVKKFVENVKKVIENIPPLCQNCKKGTLTGLGQGETLDCSFCKNPKR
jgi:tRNA(Ile2) C34 agmatinyltransferase TiaS